MGETSRPSWFVYLSTSLISSWLWQTCLSIYLSLSPTFIRCVVSHMCCHFHCPKINEVTVQSLLLNTLRRRREWRIGSDTDSRRRKIDFHWVHSSCSHSCCGCCHELCLCPSLLSFFFSHKSLSETNDYSVKTVHVSQDLMRGVVPLVSETETSFFRSTRLLLRYKVLKYDFLFFRFVLKMTFLLRSIKIEAS